MKKKRYLLIIIGLFVVLGLAYNYYRLQVTSSGGSSKTAPILKNYEFLLDGKGLVLEWDKGQETTSLDYKVGKKYIVTESYKFNYDFNREKYSSEYRNTYQSGEYFTLTVYDINQKMASREIDIFNLVRNYNKNYIPKTDYGYFYGADTEYVKIWAWDKSSSDPSHTSVSLYINLATQKIDYSFSYQFSGDYMLLEDTSEEEKELNSRLKTSKSTGFNSLGDVPSIETLLESQGIRVYINNNISIDSLKVTEVNTELSKKWLLKEEYPDAYKLFLENPHLYLLTDEADLSLKAEALSLFLPKGTNLFENVTLPADYSTDGQEHTVNSYDEFVKYFKEESE